MVGFMIELMPHDRCMCFIILQSHTQSRDASNNAIISEWFVDVAIRVYFDDFHEIVVPPCKNTKPV
jgi:hypothetical protein